MTTMRDALQAKQKHEEGLEPNRQIYKGELVEVDGSVEVSGRPGFVWVREYGQEHVCQIFNPGALAIAGLPVKIGNDPKYPFRRQILSADFETLALSPTYTGSPYLPAHGDDHEVRDGASPLDPVWIYQRALMMLRTSASPSGGLKVDVTPLAYILDGAVMSFQGQKSIDLSGYQPAVGLACYVLIYLNKATGVINTVAGGTAVDSAVITPPTPPVPANVIPSALVRIDGSQSSIVETDIRDLRIFPNETPASGGGGGGGSSGGAKSTSLPCCGA